MFAKNIMSCIACSSVVTAAPKPLSDGINWGSGTPKSQLLSYHGFVILSRLKLPYAIRDIVETQTTLCTNITM